MHRHFIILAVVGLVSCSPQQKKREVYSILYDTTDPLLAMPEAESLWGYMKGDDTDKDLVFRYSRLSDVDMNVVQQLERPAKQSGLFSNAIQEKKRIEAFQKEFNDLITPLGGSGEPYSAIFKPILAEMEYLASLPPDYEKHLIVYSNLMENSDWLSFYRGSDLWLLKYKPKKVIARYLEQIPKNVNYTDVQIHIIFVPKDYEDNIRFKSLRAVYTKVFHQMGISVSFSGNLSNASTPR